MDDKGDHILVDDEYPLGLTGRCGVWIDFINGPTIPDFRTFCAYRVKPWTIREQSKIHKRTKFLDFRLAL